MPLRVCESSYLLKQSFMITTLGHLEKPRTSQTMLISLMARRNEMSHSIAIVKFANASVGDFGHIDTMH